MQLEWEHTLSSSILPGSILPGSSTATRRRSLCRATAALVVAGFLLVALASPGWSQVGRSPVQVSGASPVASCDDGTPGDGVTPNTEAEPAVAVSPQRPSIAAVAYRTDQWATGSSRAIVVASTRNGRTFTRTVLPGVGECAGGQGRATNPWLTFSPSGVLYASATETGGEITSITVSRSTDGGRSWSQPAVVGRDDRARYFNDKQVLTVDRHDPRRLYVVWNRRDISEDRHDVMFARSTDGGSTWEPARSIHRLGTAGLGTIGNQIVVLPDGDLVNLFMENDHPVGGPPIPEDLPERVRVMRSTDAGATWSEPSTVADVDINQPLLPDNPPYIPMIAPGIVPDIAVDDRSGDLYAVWGDATLSESFSAIALSTSDDGGRTWSTPRKVNLTPDSPALGSGQAFLPQVDVTPNGTIGVSYYDFRNNTPAAGSPTDMWLATCRGPACAGSPDGWRERHLGGPFDVERAPYWFGGPYIGSYYGLTHARNRFVASFVMTTPQEGNPTDVFVATAPPGGQPVTAGGLAPDSSGS